MRVCLARGVMLALSYGACQNTHTVRTGQDPYITNVPLHGSESPTGRTPACVCVCDWRARFESWGRACFRRQKFWESTNDTLQEFFAVSPVRCSRTHHTRQTSRSTSKDNGIPRRTTKLLRYPVGCARKWDTRPLCAPQDPRATPLRWSPANPGNTTSPVPPRGRTRDARSTPPP